MKYFIQFTAAASFALTAQAAMAETEITWWHGMGGHLGDVVNQIAEGFNESQDDYTITPVFKGSYEETLTAAIAAFRAGEQPNIVQVFDAGSATIIGAKGKPKQKRDAADGRWLSICPLVFGDGELGFLALVMQGSFPEERTGPALAADALAASAEAGELEKAAVDRMLGEGVEATLASSVAPVQERTVKSVFEESEDPAIRNVLIATSKSGYSNEVLHNDMFRKGCEQLKTREPWRFPFVRSSLLALLLCSGLCFRRLEQRA